MCWGAVFLFFLEPSNDLTLNIRLRIRDRDLALQRTLLRLRWGLPHPQTLLRVIQKLQIGIIRVVHQRVEERLPLGILRHLPDYLVRLESPEHLLELALLLAAPQLELVFRVGHVEGVGYAALAEGTGLEVFVDFGDAGVVLFAGFVAGMC
jgi:hypothetical protein